MSTLEPIYAETAEYCGWSLVDLSPPFDLEAFIAASYVRAAPTASAAVKASKRRSR